MDIAALNGAISSLKVAVDISRALLQMKVSSDVESKVADLQGALLDAQQNALAATAAQFELQERVRKLEAELAARSDWENQRKRYQLVSPWRGPAQTYVLRREAADGEASHFACTRCFHERKLSILNPITNAGGFVQLVCPTCKATMDTGYRGIGSAKYAEDYASAG